MKQMLFLICCIGFAAFLISQEIQHEAVAINIGVPVRVFKGDNFIDDLTMGDFELYDDGKLQKLEAMYLVKKTDIERKDTDLVSDKSPITIAPELNRLFVLSFVISEYMPRIADAIAFFFDNVILPGDSLIIDKFVKSYNLNKEALIKVPKDEIKKRLVSLIRKDVVTGNSEYGNLIRDLGRYARAGELTNYEIAIMRLRNLRYVDEKKLVKFAQYLKSIEGQKHVFLFYQQESFPVLVRRSSSGSEGIYTGSRDSFPFLSQTNNFVKTDLITQAFSDSSISVHFMYLKKDLSDLFDITQMRVSSGYGFVDVSNDIFQAFDSVAQATGGLTDTTANVSYAMKKASQAAENYYLLYFSPTDYRNDGKFHEIEVKVKGKKYKVTHKAGYIAD